MLHINFTESGLYLERIGVANLSEFINQRLNLGNLLGESLLISAERPSILLYFDALFEEKDLEALLSEPNLFIDVDVDEECFEVVFYQGTWIAKTDEPNLGILLVEFSEQMEIIIEETWRRSLEFVNLL